MNIEHEFKLTQKDIIVLGCSSGPDSMALLDMLLKVKSKYELTIICAHINHNQRTISEKEALFLQEYCESNNIAFEYMIIDEYGDDNFHNESRNIRYQFFESLVKKYNANYLMTAHHGDDLVETILMRMVRGSNLKGYSAFQKITPMPGYDLVRPLITFTKEDILEYNNSCGVSYFTDESNKDDKYTRNRYRKEILPFLKEEERNVHLKFLKYSEELISASKYINKERDKIIKKVIKDKKLSITLFKEVDEYMQKEILYYMLNEYYQDDLILLNDKHIHLLLDLIYSNKKNAGAFVNLPNEVVAFKSYDKFILKRQVDTITSYEIELIKHIHLPNGHTLELVEEEQSNSNNICRLDSREITLPLIVRTRKYGDKIWVKGMNGSKKIKDIFIDEKVPLKNRDNHPIVVDSLGEIVFIPGIKKSKFDKKKNETYDIIIKYD